MTTDGPEYCVKNRSKTKISMFLSFWQFLIEHVAELVEDNLQAEHLFLLTYGRSKNKEIRECLYNNLQHKKYFISIHNNKTTVFKI